MCKEAMPFVDRLHSHPRHISHRNQCILDRQPNSPNRIKTKELGGISRKGHKIQPYEMPSSYLCLRPGCSRWQVVSGNSSRTRELGASTPPLNGQHYIVGKPKLVQAKK